jgi:hypothetical protein
MKSVKHWHAFRIEFDTAEEHADFSKFKRQHNIKCIMWNERYKPSTVLAPALNVAIVDYDELPKVMKYINEH